MGHPARAETLKVDREIRIPAGTGAGLRMAAGEYVQIVDVEGRGCADFFALAASNPAEYLSASHTRVQIDRLFPQVGQSFFSSLRRPMLQFEEDRTPGVHDMLFAACDPARYVQLVDLAGQVIGPDQSIVSAGLGSGNGQEDSRVDSCTQSN